MKSCICNQVFKTKQSYDAHLVKKFHIQFMRNSITTRCDICYSDKIKTSFIPCSVCRHSICLKCYNNIVTYRTFKCPFCRNTHSI